MGREYRILARFAGVASVVIFLLLPSPIWEGRIGEHVAMVAAYLAGTALLALAGKIGILVATSVNAKAAEGAGRGIKPAFLIDFRGGSVMGLAVVGFSLLGVMAVLMVTADATILLGFSFGASSLALFAKAGGGIFTKTADVSADLTGKVELGIPEDDPRNPAVIADNVGDNVGDVAGMGADLFDSNVAAMASALVMAQALDQGTGVNSAMVFCYGALGLIASIIGIACARVGKDENPTRALNSSTYTTTALFMIFTAAATWFFEGFQWRIWGASAVGLIVGVVIGITTDYFTDGSKPIVRKVAKASQSGSAFTILSGISYGFISSLPAMVGIAVSALTAYHLCDPLGDEAIRIADELDSAGNTVKAVIKGFAIGAAGLTVISLLGAYMSEVNEALAGMGKELIPAGAMAIAATVIVGFIGGHFTGKCAPASFVGGRLFGRLQIS